MSTTIRHPHPPVQPADHAHVTDLETCLDLINTVELTDGIPEDRLPTVTDALSWFDRTGVAHVHDLQAQAGTSPDAWLARVQAARASLRDVWDAAVDGRAAASTAVETLNDILARAPHPELRSAPDGVSVGHRHDAADPTGEALARVAAPLVDALAVGDTSRFRVCANDGCRWVFEDTSRGGRRRWCDMTTCGNRAKVRRFRSKRRNPADPVGERPPEG